MQQMKQFMRLERDCSLDYFPNETQCSSSYGSAYRHRVYLSKYDFYNHSMVHSTTNDTLSRPYAYARRSKPSAN